MDELNTIIGRQVKAKRLESGISQAELAKNVGVKIKAMNLIENGKTFPSQATLKKLSEFFGVHARFFFNKTVYTNSMKKEDLITDIEISLAELSEEELVKLRKFMNLWFFEK